MPNWCNNTLTITGDANSIADFRSHLGQHEGEITLSFNDFVPRPPEEETNWFSWNCDNWGCKWDLNPQDTSMCFSESELLFDFETAWSPPIAWVDTVSGMFPSLRFKLEFDEPCMNFSGIRVFVNNFAIEVVDGDSYTSDDDTENSEDKFADY